LVEMKYHLEGSKEHMERILHTRRSLPPQVVTKLIKEVAYDWNTDVEKSTTSPSAISTLRHMNAGSVLMATRMRVSTSEHRHIYLDGSLNPTRYYLSAILIILTLGL